MTYETSRYPSTLRLDVVQKLHGVSVADPYRWLEDSNSSRTKTWSDAQAKLYLAYKASPEQVSRWRSMITALYSVEFSSVPVHKGKRVFRKIHPVDSDHARLAVTEQGLERVLVDPYEIDPSGATVLESWEPSRDGTLVAFQLSSGGAEDCVLQVLDVRTGETKEDPIDRVRRSPIAWLPGESSFWYVRRLAPDLVPGEERFHRRVYCHEIGSDPKSDDLIFGEGRGPTQYYNLEDTPNGRLVILSATAGADKSTDLWLCDLGTEPGSGVTLKTVHSGVRARTRLRFGSAASADGTIWACTDLKAPRGRVIVTNTDDPSPRAWREFIAERQDAVLADFIILDGPELERPLGLVNWSVHAVSEITVHDLKDGKQIGAVAVPGLGTIEDMTVSPAQPYEAWFRYTDFSTHPVVLRFDARTSTTSIPAASNAEIPDSVRCCQVMYSSRDGTPVRMFILYDGAHSDGPRPTILSGYGGFGASMAPGYMPHAVAWVQAGGVYALACLRGGGEEGEEWHEAGRGAAKQNVFDDFDAAGDFLVSAGWTTRGQLGIMGGSNGGLLVAAALTQHPEKYAAVVAMDALLDMIRYENSGMGPSWREEYGSAENPGEARMLLSYSPYHRVRSGIRYPPVLLTASAADTRVSPWHARKMCAALQFASGAPPAERPIVFRLEQGAGHGLRARGRAVELFAEVLSFFGQHLGLHIR